MQNKHPWPHNIGKQFFETTPVVEVAQWLIGKILCRSIQGQIIASIICETEAYNGVFDKACHAYGGKKTNRTLNLYTPAGTAYVYLCYGVHYLLNIVTQNQETPNAVLIRGGIVIEGYTLTQSPNKTAMAYSTSGPGRLSKALQIGQLHNGLDLCNSNELWICDAGIKIAKKEILISSRIGIDYAEEDALLPYRFFLSKEKMQELFEKYSN